MTAGVMGVLAVGAAVVWVGWASPAQWEARDNGLVLTEGASRGQFSVVAVFVVIGTVTSIVWGAWAQRRHPDSGWFIVGFVAAVAALASVLTWQLGTAWGPPDPRTLTDLAIGDKVPAQIAVDAPAAFVMWPLFSVVGALISVWLTGPIESETPPLD